MAVASKLCITIPQLSLQQSDDDNGDDINAFKTDLLFNNYNS